MATAMEIRRTIFNFPLAKWRLTTENLLEVSKLANAIRRYPLPSRAQMQTEKNGNFCSKVRYCTKNFLNPADFWLFFVL